MSKSKKKKKELKITQQEVKITVAPSSLLSDEISIGKYRIPSKRIFMISLLAMAVFILAGASQVGAPADEPIDYSYGTACLHYFSTFGKDTSFAALKVNNVSFPDQKYYGAAFEMVAPLINLILQPKSPFPTHHYLCALAGIALLLYTGLIAKQLKGWNAGLLALWLIFLTPIVTGNAFFNSKDIPFAAAFAAGIYYTVMFLYLLPKVSRGAAIGIGVSVAAAVSIRVSGILLPAYIAMFTVVWYIMNVKKRKEANFFINYFLSVGFALAAGILLALITYPNFWREGIEHITGGLAATKKFKHDIYMLYDDKILSSQKINTPSYLFKYLMMSVPELVLGGFLLSMIILLIYRNRFTTGINWMLFFAAIFPFAYVMLIKAPVYNGWRHVMFAYPFVVVVTALGFTELLQVMKQPAMRYATVAVIIIAMADLLVWQVQAFPYNYVYYNHLSGGVKGIYKHYDTDYQQLSTYEGVKWLLENEKVDANKRITILSNNANSLQYDYDSSSIKFNYIAVKDMWMTPWDYAVISTVFLNEKAINAMFPPYGTIHTVERLGVPLAFVVKRPSLDDLIAYRMIKNDSLNFAAPLIDHIYQTNKTNPMAWYWKACNLFTDGKYNESLQLAQRYNELFPGQDYIYELAGYDYFRLNQFDQALKYLQFVYKIRPEKKIYNRMIGDCLVNLGRKQEAEYYYQRAK